MKYIITALLAMTLVPSLGRAQLIINEIMQSNIDCISDDLNQFPDSWVELYNTGTTNETLSDYSIGEQADAEKAWKLPKGISLAPNRFYIIYCDKEATDKHTDFRLNTGKDFSLYLFKNGVIVDSLSGLKKMPSPNVAYGRLSPSSSEWDYETQPTPGSANKTTGVKGFLGEPIFSREGCVMEKGESFQLTITPPDDAPEGTTVHYTVDGTEPNQYSLKLKKGAYIQVDGTKVIRATLHCDGYVSPRSSVHSYIFLDREMTLPVISITTDPKYLYDDKKGIYTKGTYNSDKPNYKYDWRRPINIELFDKPNENSALNQLCETRVAGAASRDITLKSLAIYADERFGKKKFKYEFFPDQRPGQTSYKSLLLRNAGNDFDYLYMRDALCQRVMATYTDIDWQAWRPAIIYMNGEHKGILNIRERANENNIYSNYNGQDDIDLIENWYQLKSGTWDKYNAFKAFYTEEGHTWDEYSEWMDCYEFINLMIMDCYFNNIDFPSNNIVMWRPRTEDGKWRWIAKDLDLSTGIYATGYSRVDFEYFNWLYDSSYDKEAFWGNSETGTRLFRRLMADATFARKFIDRYLVYMGDFLNFEGIWKVWEPMYEMIRSEYPVHRKLFNEWWPKYDNELARVQEWMKERNHYATSNLGEFYGLGDIVELKLNDDMSDNDIEGMQMVMNGVTLTNGRFNGSWFAGRKVTLSATFEDENKEVTGWIVTYNNKGSITKTEYYRPIINLSIPNTTWTSINPIISIADGIDNKIEKNDDKRPDNLYDLLGRRVTKVRRGQIVIDKNKIKIVKDND